jgi:aminoglycoside/choline kinase family phosphotransferase
MNLNNKNLKKIKGDASYRYFYRKKSNTKNSIIVYANKEKERNLLIYDAINNLLIKNNILAPKLYNENYKKNFIEIEDFGDLTLFKLLKKKTTNKLSLFKGSIHLLNKIQKIQENKIKNFKGKYYKIETYNNKKLLDETKLFSIWYVSKFIPKNKQSKFNRLIKKQTKLLLSKIKLKNNIFVHRDFHVSNLMKYKNEIATIDTQDALIGNRAYDLASLVDDVRFKTTLQFKNKIYNYYLNLNKININKSYFKNDFEILSVLRNLKIIGIFTRLAIRDKKTKYLKLIPYTWKLIELRMEKNIVFNELKKLLDINFSNKIRNQ